MVAMERTSMVYLPGREMWFAVASSVISPSSAAMSICSALVMDMYLSIRLSRSSADSRWVETTSMSRKSSPLYAFEPLSFMAAAA